MSNYSYLTCCDLDRIYPSVQNADYAVVEHTIAAGAYCVPMLWLCLFEPGDLQSHKFEENGESMQATAPLAARQTAIARLAQSVPRLEAGLGLAAGSLASYGDALRDTLAGATGQYVSIEWEEIAAMSDPKQFIADATVALRHLAGEKVGGGGGGWRKLFGGGDKVDVRKALLLGSDFAARGTVPSAKDYFEAVGDDKQKARDFECLLGAAWERPVGWG